jgi:hypothetical protein
MSTIDVDACLVAVFRNAQLASWYRAPTEPSALAWAEALRDELEAWGR